MKKTERANVIDIYFDYLCREKTYTGSAGKVIFLSKTWRNENKTLPLQKIYALMALNLNKNLKMYYSIKEVAAMFDVSESLLRFWEKEIPTLKPKTTSNNVRQYTEKDIENVKMVYNLVKVRGFKLQAARKMLHENRGNVEKNARVIEGLTRVRDELKELKRQMDYLT